MVSLERFPIECFAKNAVFFYQILQPSLKKTRFDPSGALTIFGLLIIETIKKYRKCPPLQ